MKHERNKFLCKEFLKTLQIIIPFNQTIYIRMVFQTIYTCCLYFMNWIFWFVLYQV